MDNSLSDFEEKKPLSVLKKQNKQSNSKPKTKKSIKRIRGQKDIRSALKAKNDLISYTNEFDKVCKLTGIDVDTEQLQLAIALSKSLQENNTEASSSDTVINTESSQERIGKIRSTLLEYGFKVPEIKIETKKRGKKLRKNYKLLLTSDAEKQQIIVDKYSQLLLAHINSKTDNTTDLESDNYTDFKKISNKLYQIATNTPYNCIKSDKTFYVNDLLELHVNSIGSLLRDWSEIPGRPCSPLIERLNFKFTETDFTEKELDIILSGTFKSVKDIVKDKVLTDIGSKVDNIEREERNMEHKDEIFSVEDYQEVNNLSNDKSDVADKLSVPLTVRSYSPDIFDDEVSSIMEESTTKITQEIPNRNNTNINNDLMDLTECVKTTKCSQVVSQGTNVTKRKSDDFMEITDCVAISSQPIRDNIDLTQSPDDRNNTHSNNKDNHKETKTIDITSSGEGESIKNTSNENIEMDLTQSDSEDSLPFVFVSGKDKSLDETVILNEEDILSIKPSNCMDKIQLNDSGNENLTDLVKIITIKENNTSKVNANSSTDKEVSLSAIEIDRDKRITNCVSFYEEFVHRHSDENDKTSMEKNVDESSEKNIDYDKSIDLNETTDIRKSLQSSFNNENLSKIDGDDEIITFDESSNGIKHNDEKIDLTGTSDDRNPSKTSISDTSYNINGDGITKFDECYDTNNPNSFDDGNSVEKIFNNTNSDLSKKDEILTFDESYAAKDDNNIDLTQTSDSSNGKDLDTVLNNSSNHGKKYDISIDYDEIFDNIVNSASKSTNSIQKDKSNLNNTGDDSSKISKPETECLSQESVFEISDNELDYSMQKSRYETDNFDIGGLSVIDNIPSARNSEVSEIMKNNDFIDNITITNKVINTDEIDLPKIQLKTAKSSLKNDNKTKDTPIREGLTKLPLNTPSNSEYIVKTDDVTPMVDYETLSTPERNKELDKFGLKPLKRKRAIQLLTHLYNQTHPIIEDCDLPSPSKRPKHTPIEPRKIISTSQKSPRKMAKSPQKLGKSPRKCPRKEFDSLQKNDIDGNSPQNDVESINDLQEGKENIFQVTSEKPVIKDLGSNPDDWVFQKREKAKVHSCRLPLHIAFHNYVSCRRGLLEAILRYEPVNIDGIHKGLVADGHRYDPKDLLRFLDKKCITVKTDNNKNKKHY